jgi:hypothetical protein
MQRLFRPTALHIRYLLKTSYVACRCALYSCLSFSVFQNFYFALLVVLSCSEAMRDPTVKTEPLSLKRSPPRGSFI